MAEPEAPAGNGDNSFGFLTHKIGPLPVWMWSLIAVGAYYWYTHYGPGASKQAAQTTQVERDQNVGPVTFGGGSKYKTNAEWEDAAVSFLVGESVPPDQASAAVFNYLHSKALNTQEQKDVNLAISGIGPPPKIPEPAEVTKPQPKPNQRGKGTREVTISRNETLAQLARRRHWTKATVRQVERENVIAGHGQLKPGTELSRGQEILRPRRRQ